MKSKKMFRNMLVLSICLNVVFIGIAGLFVYKKGGISYLASKIPTSATSAKASSFPYYEDRISLFESKSLDREDIVIIGDSLVDYAEWNELIPDSRIKNRGIAGDTSEGVLNRISNISQSKPKIVLVSVGINDLQRGIKTNDVIKKYELIISNIKVNSPQTEIIFTSVLPVNLNNYKENFPDYDGAEINKNVIVLNKDLQSLASRENAKYIDLYSELTVSDELKENFTHDGLHLNSDAYEIWTKEINKLIKQ
ncbi:GDSL-type esterase/lipase family protein [Priestia flexa]|uniref:GDSL-type esterase/lipase family protein n=1 Tax=Priestia flexa TaxID=86664 RepID=UPI003D28940C